MTHEKKIENILEQKLSGIYEFHSEFLYIYENHLNTHQ